MKHKNEKQKHEKEQQIEKVDKYFIKTPDKPNYLFSRILMILGIVLLAYGYGNNYHDIGAMASLAGMVFLLIGFFSYLSRRSVYKRLYKKAEPKYNDKEMDDLVENGINQVISEARERLDIDAEDIRSLPLYIDGPEKDSLMGYGKDKILRFRYHNILVFFLTDHNIATFHCTLDLGCSEILQDRTKEFPYKDITNLETETTNDVFHYSTNKKLNVEGIKKLSIYTSGGNVTSVNYFFDKDVADTDDYKLPPSDAEQTIRAIRKKLKEYKDREEKKQK
jgi:hypothetical protein